MKTQLTYFALLALISLSFISTATLDNHVLTINKRNLLRVSDFIEEVNSVFPGRKENEKVFLKEFIFSNKVYFGTLGYWELMESINEIVVEYVQSISVKFDSKIIEILEKNKHYNALAEIAIVTEQFPRVVPDFGIGPINFEKHAMDYKLMHKTIVDEKGLLIINLPSFSDELDIILNPNNESDPFVFTSKKLYDYAFAEVVPSEVITIELFHLSIFNYLRELDLSNLETLRFIHALNKINGCEKKNSNCTISIPDYVDAILEKHEDRGLLVQFGLSGVKYLPKIKEHDAQVERLEIKYGVERFGLEIKYGY